VLQYDLCKPAPYISHKVLLAIRVSIAVLLLAESLFTIIVEGSISLAYFSEWSLYMTTICFALMAYSQVTNVVKMTQFNIEINIDDDQPALTTGNDTTMLAKKSSFLPKFLILLYAACFSFCLQALLTFWIAFAFDAYIGPFDGTRKQEVSIFMENTVPTIFLMIEYPFNMIPVNIRQLHIDLAIYLVWGIVSVIYEMATDNPLYGPMSWRRDPGEAFGWYLLGFCIEILVFIGIWAMTEFVKLPRYSV